MGIYILNLATGGFAATVMSSSCGGCNDLLIWPGFEGKAFPPDVIVGIYLHIVFSNKSAVEVSRLRL